MHLSFFVNFDFIKVLWNGNTFFSFRLNYLSNDRYNNVRNTVSQLSIGLNFQEKLRKKQRETTKKKRDFVSGLLKNTQFPSDNREKA